MVLSNGQPDSYNVDTLCIEAHVSAQEEIPHGTNSGGEGSARVVHLVIRANARRDLSDKKDSLVDFVASMEMPITRLPFLMTVTLEMSEKESLQSAEKLSLLGGRGILRRRTFIEAQEIAEKAMESPAGYSEEQGVASPLWFSSDTRLKEDRDQWCALAFRFQMLL